MNALVAQYPALIVVLPLLCACLIGAASWRKPFLCFPLALAGLAGAFGSAVGLMLEVARTGEVVYKLGGWDPPMGIVYVIDRFNGLVLAVVAFAALMNLISARPEIERAHPHKLGPFYALYLLATVGMMGIVITGDAFNLYVLLEIAALSGYALIAMGDNRAPLASLNYLFMGTIGATFYLLGVGLLYVRTGTLNMADLAVRLQPLAESPALMIAFLVILLGVLMKMALFPLHGWLPGAYTHAPSAGSALMAPLATKVMIYVMIRLMISVFGLEYVFERLHLDSFLVHLATLAIVAGAVMALAQTDFKKCLTYIIVAEVGYMVGGTFLGNRLGLTGAILHLVNDALMTLCLFMAVSNLVRMTGRRTLDSLDSAFAKMPFTMAGLVVGALAVIGVPPTCGFFSKWYLLLGGIRAGQWGFVAALILASLISAVIFFRIFEAALFSPDSKGHGQGHEPDDHHGPVMAEAPVSMVVSLIVVAASLILFGLGTNLIVSGMIEPVIPAGWGG